MRESRKVFKLQITLISFRLDVSHGKQLVKHFTNLEPRIYRSIDDFHFVG